MSNSLFQVALLLILVLSKAIDVTGQGKEGQCDHKSKLDPRPHSVSILEFGAVGDGKTSNTIAFQNAVFYLKSFADKGGAQLYVPPGRWLTGSFNLTSHLTLFLASGAIILGSQDRSRWEIVEPLPSYGRGLEFPGGRYRSLINGYMLDDVVITGDNGTIDGQGSVWWDWFSSHSLNYSRPNLVELISSNNIVVSNLTFLNAPAYNIHPVYCSNVTVQNISVYSPPGSPFTVGIVPDSSDKVCIESCNISIGYDGIALKSGWDEYGIAYGRPTTSVHIKQVYLQASTGSAIAFGSEMSGGISDVLVENLHLYNSIVGIEFRTTKGRGGYITEIIILDVEMQNVHTAFGATGQRGSHPDDKYDPNAFPTLNQITVKDVTGSNITLAGSFTGIEESPFTSICLSNVVLSVTSGSSTSWVCSNVSGFSEFVIPEPCPDLSRSFPNSSSACFSLLSLKVNMGSSTNIRDLLTAFSPSLDLFAISTGDGRIKIWDTVKGQVQTEFSEIVSTNTTNLLAKPEGGHLSVDYKCMKWLSLEKKKKRKLGTSLLVLGTGSGDALALDVSAGQLKWRVNDCHPGGVTAVSFPTHGSCIYTAGADGMICELDSMTGNLVGKFRASTKAISSMSVASVTTYSTFFDYCNLGRAFKLDGKTVATAAAQLKIFDCSNRKKLQKFSGHPGAVHCMIFSEDGKYILSSSVGERYVAIWRIDGSKNQSACCVLAMDHPAVFLDCKGIDTGDADDGGLYVLAISETGVCFLWYGKNIEDLRHSKATKVSLSLSDSLYKNIKGGVPTVFAAKLQGVRVPDSGHLFVAYGLLVKPSFEKVLVQPGKDITLNSSLDGILLGTSQSRKSKKRSDMQNQITALDRANAEDALLQAPKIYNLVDGEIGAKPMMDKGDMEVDKVSVCMEDQLRAQGIINSDDGLASNSKFDSKLLKGINLEANIPQRKMRAAILSTTPSDAYKLLTVLLVMWESRSCSGKHVLAWICCILVNHSDYVISQEPDNQLLESLYKASSSKLRLQVISFHLSESPSKGQNANILLTFSISFELPC
ncbi:hypothetical protein RJ639_005734 [Escallonia herrerae]|uniref:Small-subunit processome Utp12 domain-containing protein n=1 Tax=Escallonia herrerae TaxID=1293975 RepID=A0AA89AV26_9ASTE|nr:hypothetical protein RJ639_005734 [Escallonia herrerae]